VDEHLVGAASAADPASSMAAKAAPTPAAHDAHEHDHEPAIMIWPLIVLAIGATLAGFLNWPEREKSLGGFLGNSPSLVLAHDVTNARYGAGSILPVPFGAEEMEDAAVLAQMRNIHISVALASVFAAGGGIALAYLLHLKRRERAEALAAQHPALVRALEAKFWVDEIYQQGVVEPLRWLGRKFYQLDTYVVDGIVWLIGFVPQLFGFTLKLTTQRGSLQGYAATMLLAVVVILLVLFL
jgi:NADH:ubiquinone oxidoreductase subunit 5 (subunit L)/multisubunit Na+/H+ antiporter MnhA subunit